MKKLLILKFVFWQILLINIGQPTLTAQIETEKPWEVPHEFLKYYVGQNHWQYQMGLKTWDRHHSYGQVKGNRVESGIRSKRRKGCLIYGPYEKLPATMGDLIVTVKLEVKQYHQETTYNEEWIKRYNKWNGVHDERPLPESYSLDKLVRIDFIMGDISLKKYILAGMLHLSKAQHIHVNTKLFKKKNMWGQKYNYKKVETWKIYRELKKPKKFEISLSLDKFMPKSDQPYEVRVCNIAANTNIVWDSTDVFFAF